MNYGSLGRAVQDRPEMTGVLLLCWFI